MKGFMYLLEISIALILMLVVLATLSTYSVKESWERSDLIGIGDNIIEIIRYGGIQDILNGDLDVFNVLKPPNVDFGLKVSGISKNNITVGCTDTTSCNYLDSLLTDSYVNNRWISFSVEQFDIVQGVPSDYDAVIFVNFTEYSTHKSKIIDYSNRGGIVLGINASFNNNDDDFRDIFGLDPTGAAAVGTIFNFTWYNPSEDEIEKYFLGLGFDIKTPNVEPAIAIKWGNWNIWEEERKVNITTTNTVGVENKTVDEGIIQDVPEGGSFNLKGPDNKFYTFKVKKIFWDDDLVIIQPINISFVFKDFSETSAVTGKVNIVSYVNDQAAMVSNNTSIWISDFPAGDEHKTLVKAALASRIKEWFLKGPDLTKEYVAVSSFYSLCCDMPETAELTFYLWYKI
ncbi:MAG: hypothetical protein GTN36_02055 [Candidatus Aenigmarchaeota archaeon]|nr:hypothetical protein [Candidatus Aenigmarchaeota archaeon]